jgi:hypothetical protein
MCILQKTAGKYRFIPILIFFFSVSFDSYAQIYALNTSSYSYDLLQDTIKKKAYRKKLNPKRSMVESLLVPGWGQITNRQYWKVPVLYTGFALCIYSIDFANKHYQDFRSAYSFRMDNDTNTIDKYDPYKGSAVTRYTIEQLKSARDYYRRNLEVSVIITAGVYLINVLDAYVSAHLLKFDVDNDLSIQLQVPSFYRYQEKQYYFTGVSIRF